jgi:hypothetical protein
VTTLVELTDDVVKFTTYDDSDFVAEIPRFIQNTEELIFLTVQAPFFRAAQTGAMTSETRT